MRHLIYKLITTVFFSLSCLFSVAIQAATAVAIAAGDYHTCALTTAGGVQCWGKNDYGQLGDNSTVERLTPVDVKGAGGVGLLTGVSAISAGQMHTCALMTSGGVKCWGWNLSGSLGNNSTVAKLYPVDVKGSNDVGLLTGATAISSGFHQTCALISDGGVKCWGNNDYGQIGDNTIVERHTPVDVKGDGGVGLLSGVTAIAAGDYHTCSLMVNGGVKCWGHNAQYQLGDNTAVSKYTPVDVKGVNGVGLLSGVNAIDSGAFHSCVLIDEDGGVQCWGSNTPNTSATPVSVSGAGLIGGVTSISVAAAYSCAVTISEGVVCWGVNGRGQLGDNTTINKSSPVSVVGVDGVGVLSDIESVTGGYYHTCALTTLGGVQCWGSNDYGQLGDNTKISRTIPVDVFGLPNDIDGDSVFDSLDNCPQIYNFDQENFDGDVFGDACDSDDDNDGTPDISDVFPLNAAEWLDSDNDGAGNNADLDDDNDGTPDASDAFPLDASEVADTDGDGSGNNADALPENPSETLDTDKDGIGNNADYDDDNDTLADTWELAHGRDPLVPDYDIAAGGNGGCAITDDGLQCWGDNGNGQGNPPALPDPHDIARGLEHACAVSGSAVVCWGANNVNQTAVPALTNPKGVAAGHNNNCATDDSGVKCWGEGGNGINTPPATTKPRNVDVGDDHACAVDATGVKCWGNNSTGETTVPALQEPTQVSAGKDFSCARDKNGVKCWGDNTNGKKNAPVMPAVKQVDAGEDHACAVAADGVHCWGNNDMGQTTVPAGLQNPVAVAAGNKFTCVLDESGIRCWGDNSNGQANVPSLGVDPDGDGVITSLDAFWLDPTESADNDSDGIGNNGDIDDDNDGVSDVLEAGLGTNPNTADNFTNAIHLDSDGDGIGNVKESAIGTSPFLTDSDSDGVSDDMELIQFITNPMSADSDGDTIPDNIDPEPGVGACTMPLNGLYKGSKIGDGVGL